VLSDVVVAERRMGTLRRGSHQIAPAPGHAVLADAPFGLYHEIYGARAGDSLSVTITVLPAREESLLAQLRSLIANRSAFSVAFNDVARPDADGAIRVEREISSDLLPGSYSIVLTVQSTRTKVTATAETALTVVKP
jgi:hypothetical protein